MSDSDFATQANDEFTQEDFCEGCVPLEPNEFAVLKLATKKTVKYFVGLIEEMERDVYNTRFLNKRPTCWKFCLSNNKDAVVKDLTNIVLKLPHLRVSVSRRKKSSQYEFWPELVSS
jgi:hypothetical protein